MKAFVIMALGMIILILIIVSPKITHSGAESESIPVSGPSAYVVDHGVYLDCEEDADCLRAEIRYLRSNGSRILSKAIEMCCHDSMAFYFSMLGDSLFYGCYGDYGQPTKWFIAAERLGQIGIPAVPGLIEKMSSSSGFERAMALYAFELAVSEKDLKEFAGLNMPWTYLEVRDMTDADKIKAAKTWFKKCSQAWEQIEE